MKKIKIIISIIFLFIIYIYITYVTLIPENIILIENEGLRIRKLYGINLIETTQTSNNNYNVSNIDIKLLGNISLKKINVTKIEDLSIIPVGKIIGLKLYTNGVLVVGKSEVEDINSNLIKPYYNTDIKEGDTILKIDGEEIASTKNLKEVVNKSKGKKIKLTLLRGGSIITSNIVPIKNKENEYKLGLWVKDAATGVGTMSFYEPISQSFAVLGHGIADADTDSLINIEYGELVTSRILSIQKASLEKPGEIKGTILNQQTIGKVTKNTPFGIYGTLQNLTSLNIDTSNLVKVASRDEIQLGEAKILCSLDNNNKTEEYSIDIEKIYLDNDINNKSMLLRITDERLIQKTGGIIRGLSGAPIIQNGKFIGAITNVLVSNAEIGYGIFADLMIKQLSNIEQ